MTEFPDPFADPITISPIPEAIIPSGILVKQGECFLNAHRLALATSGMTIIEGIVLGIHEEGGRVFLPHVWNRLGDVYFDITNERIFSGSDEIAEMVYSPGYEFDVREFSAGDAFEFQLETINAAAELNAELERRSGGTADPPQTLQKGVV